MKPLGISSPQWSSVGAKLMKARTRDRLEGRVRASFGGEVEQKCLDRSRCFADQQLVAAVRLALNDQHSWHVFGKLMCQPEQCGRLTALKLKFDFIKTRRSAARLDSPFIDAQLDIAVVIADRVDSPAHPRFEDRFQGSANLLGQQRLERRPPGGLKIEILAVDLGFPFVATECGSVSRFIALDRLQMLPADVT